MQFNFILLLPGLYRQKRQPDDELDVASINLRFQIKSQAVMIQFPGVFLLLHYTIAKPRPECTCSASPLSSMSHLYILHRPRPTIPIYCAAAIPLITFLSPSERLRKIDEEARAVLGG